MKSVAVITGATDNPLLREAVASVQKQTHPRITHYIVVDGEFYEHGVRKLLGKMPKDTNGPMVRQRIVILPNNTGGDGFVCHRINGAFPWLVNEDYVCFLDQDNLFGDAEHITSLLNSLVPGARWAYSLRKIIDREGNVVCNDACESLGFIAHTVLHVDDRLIDTNCYLLERELAVQISPLWNVKARQPGVMEADRQVCRILMEQEPLHGVSRRHSVLYRVDGRSNSVTAEFFERGNALRAFDASKKDLYIFHFTKEATAAYFDPCASSAQKDPLGEWCMTIWSDVCRGNYNVFDGFANLGFLPFGCVCIVVMCHPSSLPLDVLRNRKDLKRILYTAEGPNIRHKTQWTRSFLLSHFDVILTYWKPLLEDESVQTVLCPHNARFLSFPKDEPLLLCNQGVGKSVGMVLERRALRGNYMIDGHVLTCLDSLREAFALGMKELTVYGDGWLEFASEHPEISVGYSKPRHIDTNRSVDLLCKFTFALIVENCDAEGYVSEKIGDAFIAGCIPLYYGNASEHVPIPEDMYINIKRSSCNSGSDIQALLDALSNEDIENFRKRIYENRVEFLKARGSKAVSVAVKEALDMFS